MTTRFNAGDPFGVPSGYAGASVPSNFELPGVGIEDVDRALFTYFDRDLQLMISNQPSAPAQKVPIIFAAGEKWAMIKKGRALRDNTGALILPLVTIRRKEIQQDVKNDITGRGINQQTGELVIKRRLSAADRSYQNLVNKLGIANQQNVADSTETFLTDRPIGENKYDSDVLQGGLLSSKVGNNIWEIIVIPSPQFFTVTYELLFWTQHMQHMNQLINKIMAANLPTANGTFRIETPAGYWFIANFEGNTFVPDDNADDASKDERILRYRTTVKVAGYAVLPKAPGIPNGIRRFYSAPLVSFGIDGVDEQLIDAIPTKTDPMEGFDDPTLGYTLSGEIQPRERATIQEPTNRVKITVNPFSKKTRIEYARVVTRDSRNGETVLRPDETVVAKIVDS